MTRSAVERGEHRDERPRPYRSEGRRRTRRGRGGRRAAPARREEDADADEHVVVRDPDTGDVDEEPAQ